MIAGIDYDTHAVHVVFLREDAPPAYLPMRLEGQDAFERTRSVRTAMPSRGSWREHVIAIGIEEPQGAQRATVAKLKAIQGAILACLPRSILVHPLVPAAWRKACGLSGGASKDEVAIFAERAKRGWPQDACDAYCIALAVESMIVQEVTT